MNIDEVTGTIHNIAKGIMPEKPGKKKMDIGQIVMQADQNHAEKERQSQAMADYVNNKHNCGMCWNENGTERKAQSAASLADKKGSLYNPTAAGSRRTENAANDREVQAILDYYDKKHKR